MPAQSNNYIVLTGGPGSGKTALIDRLAGEGMAIMPEAGRSIIQAQVEIGGNALPWGDRLLYAELMLSWEMRSYEAASHIGHLVLFDRGLPDIVGYLTLEGLAVAAHICRAAQDLRYNRSVFIAPPWPEIFRQDAERRQDHALAERTYTAMAQVYTALDYRLIELPKAPVSERAAFVRSRIGG